MTSNSNIDLYDRDHAFWDTYIKGRPQPPQSFFDRIYDYHTSHNGTFNIAHDAGAGGGVHSQRLASRFKTVIVSDISKSNITVARSRLDHTPSDSLPAPKYKYLTTRLQDLANEIDTGTIDLYFCCTAMHFPGSEVSAAIAEAARQLKPGGTLAIPAFGPVVFDDAEIQSLWARIYLLAAQIRLAARKDDALLNAWHHECSGYDSVPLPSEFFEAGAQRVRINFDERREWSWERLHARAGEEEEGLREVMGRIGRVGTGDLEVREWDEGWRVLWDLEQVGRHRDSMRHPEDDEELERLWKRLQERVGSGKVGGVVPVVLLLATRR